MTTTRIDIEHEFLALILNRPELLEFIQIKPEYLSDTKLQKILEYSIECYNKLGYVEYNEIMDKHDDFDLDLFVELLTDTFYNSNKYQQQLKYDQQKIIEFYKKDCTNKTNEEYKNKKIDYQEFVEKINKINEINLIEDTNFLGREEILKNINQKKARIHFKNYPSLDNILELVKNDFVVVGATTGGGKSGFLLNLMNDLMNDYQCIYFNMEMSKPTVYKRLISINANIPVGAIANPTDYQKELIEQSLTNIEDSKIIVENLVNDIKSIKSIIAKHKDTDKHTIVFLDHIGLMKSNNNSNKSLYEQSTEIVKQLRQICLNYDCTIIGASQMNRTAYTSDLLTLNQLKDSGEVENSASKILLLYPKEKNDRELLELDMTIDIAKNRDGRTGTLTMRYDKTKQTFKERKDYER